MLQQIDINADIGEGMPFDNDIMKFISSCNIACGGHAGDDQSIQDTIVLAKSNKVKIGAHPSYPDKDNFGRRSIDISIDELVQCIDEQLENFKSICHKVNAKWHHIKFHGALYNDLKKDDEKSRALVNLISEKYKNVILYVPPNSVIQKRAEKSLEIKVEGFADRAYSEDLSLVSRNLPNAVLTNTNNVLQHVHHLVLQEKAVTIDGKEVPLKIGTLCLHGDTPTALKLVKSIVQYLEQQKIRIE